MVLMHVERYCCPKCGGGTITYGEDYILPCEYCGNTETEF